MKITFSRPLVPPVHPVVRLQKELPRPLPQQPQKFPKEGTAENTSVSKRFIAQA